MAVDQSPSAKLFSTSAKDSAVALSLPPTGAFVAAFSNGVSNSQGSFLLGAIFLPAGNGSGLALTLPGTPWLIWALKLSGTDMKKERCKKVLVIGDFGARKYNEW